MGNDQEFIQDGNTLKYNGKEELPDCPACKNGSGEHKLLTKEHPYKMIVKEDLVKKEGDINV